MAKRGQPTKLTPELQEKICAIIASTGCSLEGAAASCEVSGQTLYNWRGRGLIEGKGLYFEFVQAVSRAKEKSEPTLAACIARAAKEDWRAALAILERRFPERWGNQVTIIRKFESMTDDELDAYIAGRLGVEEPEKNEVEAEREA
jgi:hypothetical protein